MAHEKGLEAEVAELNQEHNALQNELRMTQEAVGRVEVDAQAKARRIQELEFENEDIAQELESIDKSLIEANGKNEKLSIELESRQGECAFLREEQDGCMLKIGDLENANKALQTSLSSEKDRARELEARLAEERHQHEVIGGKEKQEVQRMTNDLNREIAAAKEESRKLKKIVETREVEARSWKEKLVELETSLREVLGDGGSRSSWIVVSVLQIQIGQSPNNGKDYIQTSERLGERQCRAHSNAELAVRQGAAASEARRSARKSWS
jgi:chromosome segregation ATPase